MNNLGAGRFDWIEVWRRMYEDKRNQSRTASESGFELPPDYWAAVADRFATSASRVPQPDGFMQFLLPHLRSNDTVLDVGAGTGRYTSQLSSRVASVIAIEPSDSMRIYLEHSISEKELQNVRVLGVEWPDRTVPRTDVVICSHVLHGVRDVAPFVQVMDEVAQRACYICLSLHLSTSFISKLWTRFRDDQRFPLPCALEALNVLHQIGIPANLQIVPVTSKYSFANLDEALIDVRHRLRFAPEPKRDERIREAIKELLQPMPDGSLIPIDQAQQEAVLWWEK